MCKVFRYVFVAPLFASMMVAIGCSRSEQNTSGSGADSAQVGERAAQRLTVAVIPKSTGGEFWETVEMGARAAGSELGVEIKWEGAHHETDLAEQNKIIESMVNLGVDGMALAPLNNRVMRKPVENVVAAGIPVVIFDSAVDGDAHVSYVATDNTAGGALAAQYLIDRLGPNKKRLFLLRYIQGTASTEQRSVGFLDTAKAAGFEVLGDPYSDDATVAGAIKTATNSLERFVKDGKLQVDGIFATNLFSTMGMLTALEDLRQSGVETQVVFVGFDTSPPLIQDLQQGKIDALVSQHPERMGYLAVETLVKHLRGEPIEPVIDTGAELVTRERLDDPAVRKLVGLE
ncbi:MAG: substrate-binding domain-containing protein [Pirellulales bacterium]